MAGRSTTTSTTTTFLLACLVVCAAVVASCTSDDDVGGPQATTVRMGAAEPTSSTTTAESSLGSRDPLDTGDTFDTVDTLDTSARTVPSTTVPASEADAATVEAIDDVLATSSEGCDPLDTRHCYLPYPSNALTVRDDTTATGRRLALPAAAAPTNSSGVTLDVAELNRNDGFSPNTPIITYLPGLDADRSNVPTWTDLEASLDPAASVVLVDAGTGERVPLWAELDAKAPRRRDSTLMVHPAVALTEGHTYVVALRNLRDAGGDLIEANPVFAAYRDGLVTPREEVEARREEMEAAFLTLARAGITRDDLQLAWTFSTISTEDLTGRLVHIRDRTLDRLGERAPSFEVTEVLDDPEPGIARQVTGTFTVTNWLTADGGPGNGFHYEAATPGPGELPTPNGTLQAPFTCVIADAAMEARRAHLVQYGHGLLGSQLEVTAGNINDFGNEHEAVFCATKWAGMSEDDIPNAVATLEDMSNFPTLADRLQQGVLNQMVLTRLMVADDGLVSDPAFQRPDGRPIVDNRTITYDGNSQGAIMGLALAGVSPDIDRFVLGVAGMNYSTLLARSVDFDTYELIFEPAYPDPFDRTLIIAMIQGMWDRGEGAGYVQHVTSDPLPGTPAKEMLVHVAFGDWQVSELTAFVQARTMSIPVHRPVTAPGRSREVTAGWDLEAIEYPSDGSGLVVWDSGSDPIPIPNLPPRTSRDPHEDPRANAHVRRQKAAFLFDGELIDVCSSDPCRADPVD